MMVPNSENIDITRFNQPSGLDHQPQPSIMTVQSKPIQQLTPFGHALAGELRNGHVHTLATDVPL
jgi:hypothetical protein